MVEIGHGEKKSFLFRWVIPFPDGTLELHPAAEGYPILTFTMEQQERLGLHVAGPVVVVAGQPRRVDSILEDRLLPDPSCPSGPGGVEKGASPLADRAEEAEAGQG